MKEDKNIINEVCIWGTGSMVDPKDFFKDDKIYFCPICKGTKIEYSTVAWFDVKTDSFAEHAEYNTQMHINNCYCNDCNEVSDQFLALDRFEVERPVKFSKKKHLGKVNKKDKIYNCPKCNKGKIEYSIMAWFDPNTNRFVEFFGRPFSHYCNDCEDLVENYSILKRSLNDKVSESMK